MNWDQAMVAMRDGATVRQVSTSVRTVACKDAKGRPVYHHGDEPARMATALTEHHTLCRVLVGAWCGIPFVPTRSMREATDWIVVTAEQPA